MAAKVNSLLIDNGWYKQSHNVWMQDTKFIS